MGIEPQTTQVAVAPLDGPGGLEAYPHRDDADSAIITMKGFRSAVLVDRTQARVLAAWLAEWAGDQHVTKAN